MRLDELKCNVHVVIVTVTEWLIKILCKLTFYTELIGYFRHDINVNWFITLLVIFSSYSCVTCFFMFDVFQSKGNTVAVFFFLYHYYVDFLD